MDGSDFRAPPPASSLLHLFTGARLRRTGARISLVTTCSQCQARYGLGPRGVPMPLTLMRHGLLPTGGTSPSALSNGIFGALHLQGRHNPLPLHLACFRAYASTRRLPAVPQGSILGSRLTITQAGLPPARTRGLARPHCPLFRHQGNQVAETTSQTPQGSTTAAIAIDPRGLSRSLCCALLPTHPGQRSQLRVRRSGALGRLHPIVNDVEEIDVVRT